MALPSPHPRYKLTKEITDGKFDVGRINRYALSLHLGMRDCQVGIMDREEGRLLYFCDYVFDRECAPPAQLNLLKKLIEEHAFLGAGFWRSVDCAVKNQKFAQLPAELFTPETASNYLKINAHVADEEEVMYCRHRAFDAVTVFAVWKGIVDWFRAHYNRSAVRFFHQAAGLIEGTYAASTKRRGVPMYLYVDRFKLHIIILYRGELIYYNRFSIQKFSDYIKYVMTVLKTMKMNAARTHVVLWGYMGRNSPHLAELSKYIRHVSLGVRPHRLKFGHAFDELEPHTFFDLYSMCLMAR